MSVSAIDPARGAAARPSFNEPALRGEIMRLRAVSDATSLGFLALEYLCIAAAVGGAIVFCERRGTWGLVPAWDIPVVTLAVVLIGALQHRLAGLGHEASHYTLLGSKPLNDLAGDLFCMFPILATVHFYRLFHLAHHQYTNDPERDPDIVSLGGSKMVDRFPMSRRQFIRSFYLRPLTDPRGFAGYQRDYIAINVLGCSESPYLRRRPALDASGGHWPRPGAALGIVYIGAYLAGSLAIAAAGRPDWLAYQGLAGTLLVSVVGAVLPGRAYFAAPLRQPLSARLSGWLRLVYYTWCLAALGVLGVWTGGRSTAYFLLLWILPVVTSFFYFMLLRDAYQHTNADDGRLTNTRVFFADPFTRWAIFVHGQDMHVPHHLFPGIPHHRLRRLHRLLKEYHAEYAAQVVECHGTFANREGRPTILDALAGPRPGGRDPR